MFYAARFEPAEEGGFVVTFRDIPEVLTQGDTTEEAMEMARDALLTAMEFYFDDKRAIPLPSALRKGEVLVAVPVSAAAKIYLLNEMVSQHVTASDLARRMGTIPQEVSRLIDLHYTTKIDRVGDAFSALGKSLTLSVTTA